MLTKEVIRVLYELREGWAVSVITALGRPDEIFRPAHTPFLDDLVELY